MDQSFDHAMDGGLWIRGADVKAEPLDFLSNIHGVKRSIRSDSEQNRLSQRTRQVIAIAQSRVMFGKQPEANDRIALFCNLSPKLFALSKQLFQIIAGDLQQPNPGTAINWAGGALNGQT